MKNKFYLFVGLILLAGCSADPALGPIITEKTAEVGAFPRTVELRASEFDLADVANSVYDHDIDFRSIDGGANVANYIVYVAFDDNDPSNGDLSTTPVQYQNYTQADFGDSGTGTKSLTLTYAFTDVASATGVAIADISPGDRFRFTTELILDDGRVFTAANTESTIFGPAFRAFFDWDVNATCPLPDNLFVGTYILSYDDGPNNPWGDSFDPGPCTLALIPGSTTVRSINGLIGAFAFDVEGAQVQFVCDVAQWIDGNLTAGCGGVIEYNLGAAQPQDITDDSVIILEVNEDGGGCGYTNTDVIRLTKM